MHYYDQAALDSSKLEELISKDLVSQWLFSEDSKPVARFINGLLLEWL
jgi:hypothetical protein